MRRHASCSRADLFTSRSDMKKTGTASKLESDESEVSDLSYDSSFDENDGQISRANPQSNINLFKEQMVRFLLTHPELENDIHLSNEAKAARGASSSGVPFDFLVSGGINRNDSSLTMQQQQQQQYQQSQHSSQLLGQGQQSGSGMNGIGIFAQGSGLKSHQGMQRVSSSQKEQTGFEANNKVHRNPKWESLASNLMQESKRMGIMPSIEAFSQRLNLFRKRIEKPDVIDMILTNKDILLKQIKKEEDRKAKIQNRIHETIEAKLRKEQGDVKYYSKLKKNQFDSRMQKEEARVRQTHQAAAVAASGTGTSTKNSPDRDKQYFSKRDNSQIAQAAPNQQYVSQVQQQQQAQQGGITVGASQTNIQIGSLQNIEGGRSSIITKQVRQSMTSIPNIASSSIGGGVQQSDKNGNGLKQEGGAGKGINSKSLRFLTPPISGQSSPANAKQPQQFVQQSQQEQYQPQETEGKTRKNGHLRDLESRILSSTNPVIRNNFALSAKVMAERESQYKQFKARPVPGVFERLSQDLIKKNQQQVEEEIDVPLDMEFKTAKGEQLYRDIRKKAEDEEEAKRYLIKVLADHRSKAEEEFKSKPSLLSQGQKYYSEESKEFSLLSPNLFAKKQMGSMISNGLLNADFFEQRANLEEGNVYLLTKVSKILKGNLMRKWKSIQDSQF